MVKKILLVAIYEDLLTSLGSYQAGGQNDYIKQLIYALSRKSYKVDVLTHWSNPTDPSMEIINDNLRVIRVSTLYKARSPYARGIKEGWEFFF